MPSLASDVPPFSAFFLLVFGVFCHHIVTRIPPKIQCWFFGQQKPLTRRWTDTDNNDKLYTFGPSAIDPENKSPKHVGNAPVQSDSNPYAYGNRLHYLHNMVNPCQPIYNRTVYLLFRIDDRHRTDFHSPLRLLNQRTYQDSSANTSYGNEPWNTPGTLECMFRKNAELTILFCCGGDDTTEQKRRQGVREVKSKHPPIKRVADSGCRMLDGG